MKVQRGNKDIAPAFNIGARWGGWSTPRPGRFTPGKDPIPIVKETGWAPRPVWTGAQNLAPHWDSTPDRPVRSESLYRLGYHGTQVRRQTTTIRSHHCEKPVRD
jgi:hypothetical protein